jgi:DNA-binding transcriptional MocR family regulator
MSSLNWITATSRRSVSIAASFGSLGYLPLREHLVLMLAGLGITASAVQILLTQSANQALELVIRYLLKPGDAALVDDPATSTRSAICAYLPI